MEEIYFKKEVEEKFHSGIEKLYKGVSTTMGPNGNTVALINNYNEAIITKDGVSVARSIQFKDPVENAAAFLIKQAAEKTLMDAGDGTTTATVLAYHLINNLKSFNFKDVSEVLNVVIPIIVKNLEEKSKKLKDEDIKHVANISANNDMEIGNIVQQAFDFSNIIKIEEGGNTDSLKKIEGMCLDVTYFSKHFITDTSRATCDLENPKVLIVQGRIDKFSIFEKVLNQIYQETQSILIIAEDISESVLKLLESNKINNGLKVCVIKAPGFSSFRKDLMFDLCYFTGAKLNSSIHGCSVDSLGVLESCSIKNNQSVLIKDSSINIEERIENLEKSVTEYSDQAKELIEKRIEYLTGRVSIIKVGGLTPSEVKERYDRYDDAVKAVTAAKMEGIVIGGGIALLQSTTGLKSLNCNAEILKAIIKCLEEPYKLIYKLDDDVLTAFSKHQYVENIIDPLKVTKSALLNAVSVTKIILSTDTVVLNEHLWNK